MDTKYDVIERHLLISHSGATPDWSQQKMIDPLINDFRLLQYDAMFGKPADGEALLPQPDQARGRVEQHLRFGVDALSFPEAFCGIAGRLYHS